MKHHLRLTLLLTAATIGPMFAEVKLPAVFSDHMVLQRGMPLPVWGTAAPGEKITVGIRGRTKSATAGADGKWSLKLDPLEAGGPDTLEVKGGNTVTISDVLVGEVWVGSGQSNMSQPVKGYVKNGDQVLGKWATEGSCEQIRLMTVAGKGGWQVATAATIPEFSAQMFAFGYNLQKELKVPVGLIVGAWSGMPSRCFLTRAMFDADPACVAALAKAAAAFKPDEAEKKFAEAMVKWQKAADDAKAKGGKEPRKPSKQGSPEQDRNAIGNLFPKLIQPIIPFGIRGVLWDQGEAGTGVSGVDQFLMTGALIRGWRTAWGQGDFPFVYVQKPSGGGCAWPAAGTGSQKAAGFKELPATPPDTKSGLYRDLHLRIRSYPNTFLVTSSDLTAGIHPTIKSAYGQRSSRVALGAVYGRPEEYYGPVYQSHKMEGNKVRVTFTHAGQGLSALPGQKPQGFAVAGDDQVFHWANATIDGNSVVLECPAVPKPAAVRYGWSPGLNGSTLFNKDGLPAQTFRTDNWTTSPKEAAEATETPAEAPAAPDSADPTK